MGANVDYASNVPLAEVLGSIKRPGEFCVHGRRFLPMPRLEVEGVGMLSFPVADAQLLALVEAAERAPFGKGTQTLVDTSVRDCWQIDATRIRLGGHAWAQTFSTISSMAAEGLGCPENALDAHLYKLLVYPTDGFFSPHRDTEKVNGMVATLTISLPTEGIGGELVVRHRDREMVIDMNAAEPSELAFAAFYADCTHETRPVRTGHRLSLVYNLCIRPGDTSTPRQAPDHTAEIEEIAGHLVRWRDEGVSDKLVWVLEHDYSEAGLSFDTLKNTDAALARVLVGATDHADCALHTAIVHIEEHGDAVYGNGDYVDSWNSRESDVDEMAINEIYESRHWLDGWVDRNGCRPPFDDIPLLAEELLPVGALDDAVPDEQWLHEASGNEGVSLERAYRRAAFVIWPRSKTLTVIASAGINGAVEWVAGQFAAGGAASGERIQELVSKLIGIWSHGRYDRDEDKARSRAMMLDLLAAIGDRSLAVQYVREVMLFHYSGSENARLLAVFDMLGADGEEHLPRFVEAHFFRRPDQMLALLRRIEESTTSLPRSALGASVHQAVTALPAVLNPAKHELGDGSPFDSPAPISQHGICDLFALAWRCGLTDAARTAATLVTEHPQAVTPDRAIPAALDELRGEPGVADSAYATLWHHAASFLLDRSATPPEAPKDWAVGCDIDCACELCAKLRAFCSNPVAQTERFAVRKELRQHLHRTIDNHGLDMSHETERRGRPYTLVCTKNRASHVRRLEEYAEDLSCMGSLRRSVPSVALSASRPAALHRLGEAVAAGGGR